MKLEVFSSTLKVKVPILSNFISLIKSQSSLKSFSVSFGYPTINVVLIVISGYFFTQFV